MAFAETRKLYPEQEPAKLDPLDPHPADSDLSPRYYPDSLQWWHMEAKTQQHRTAKIQGQHIAATLYPVKK